MQDKTHMEDNYFKVFTSIADHDNWSKQQEYASIREDIDNATQQEFTRALQTLESILGKHFLKSSDRHHPVKQMIIEKTKFRVAQTIQFATTLQLLKDADTELTELLRLLGSTKKALQEGIPFIEIATPYLQQGLIVTFPIPPVRQGSKNNERSPDIKIVDPITGDTFFIEVTTLNDSAKRIEEKSNSEFFHSQFHYIAPQFSFVGTQHLPIAEEEYAAIAEIIAQYKQKVAEKEEVVYYSDHRFTFILVPKEQETWLYELCHEQDIRINTITHLPINIDETLKIIYKINEEMKQLPPSSNGLIYIPITPVYLMFVNTTDIVQKIENYITRFKNLLGVVLYSKIVHTQEDSVTFINKSIFKATTVMGLCQHSLYIHNKVANLHISPQTLKKINNTL